MIMLTKEKRCGKIKGISCYDIRTNHWYIKKEDSASPTVSMEVLVAQLMIDAAENMDAAIFDVPGAYL